jgi:hypothetical protein
MTDLNEKNLTNEKVLTDENFAGALSTEDKLDVLFYQFMELHNQWSADRDVIVKQNQEMADLIKLCTKHLNTFGSLEHNMRTNLDGSIRQSVDASVAILSNQMGGIVASAVDGSAKRLSMSVERLDATFHRVDHGLQYQERRFALSTWKGFFAAVGAGLFTGVIIAVLVLDFFFPTIAPLSSQQIAYMQTGQNFTDRWNRLSPEKQQQVTALIDGA